jgi:hypothetical protein
MIDTVALTFNEDSYKISDPDRFNPPSDLLWSHTSGGVGNLICKQNPTRAELAAGLYKPRLSMTNRPRGRRETEIMLRAEFSAPKLLFGNNFDELEDADFPQIIAKLNLTLHDMGVDVHEVDLVQAPVSAIHFSKNIPLDDYSTSYIYLKQLSKVNLSQRLDLSRTDFRNEGHSLKFRANSFEIAFYDKIKDLLKAKISEKRAEEKDNALQLNLLEGMTKRRPFELLRMEIRLNTRRKLRQVLKGIGITSDPTFEALFKREIACKVLLHYMDEIVRRYPPILVYDCKDPERFLSDFMIRNPKVGLGKALQMLGVRTIIEQAGIRGFREMTKVYGRTNWYRLNHEMLAFNYPPKENDFEMLRRCLEEFKALKLVDFGQRAFTIHTTDCVPTMLKVTND